MSFSALKDTNFIKKWKSSLNIMPLNLYIYIIPYVYIYIHTPHPFLRHFWWAALLAACWGPPWSYSFLSPLTHRPACCCFYISSQGLGTSRFLSRMGVLAGVNTPRSTRGTVNYSLLASVVLAQAAARHTSPWKHWHQQYYHVAKECVFLRSLLVFVVRLQSTVLQRAKTPMLALTWSPDL